MKSMKRGGWIAGILTAALLLASCSGATSVAERVEPGLPSSLAEAGRWAISPEGPAAVWLEDGRRFALVTFGSSSCPAVVTAMEAVGTAALELHLEPSGGSGPCTADMAATTHELSLPGSVTGRLVTLTLTYPNQGEPTMLSLD